MNANPANCDCERCEIDRERAPYPQSTEDMSVAVC